MDPHYTQLKNYGKVKVDEPMSKHTTFKLGGNAAYYLVVSSITDLTAALDYVREEGLDHVVIGGGSNMLVSDTGYDGVIIQVNAKEKHIDGTDVVADAGCSTVEIAQFSIQHNLTGFEWGVGVPGTIGGAVRGNAGAMGAEMKDNVTLVDVYRDGEIITLTNSECEFAYRHSIFKDTADIVLRVRLGLEKTDSKEGMKQALSYLQYRNKTQPQGWASTGCIFKNPDLEENKDALRTNFKEDDEKVQQFLQVGKISAGWLVEQAGLKGLSVGEAKISEAHGNFIVNLGAARAQDVLDLIEQIKQDVYTKYGISLEEEIQIIA